MAIKFLNSVNADSGVLYVDAANDRVGIGTTVPTEKLHVATGMILVGTDSGDAFNGSALVGIQSTTAAYFQAKSSTTGFAGLLLGDTDDDYHAGIIYANNTSILTFNAGNSTRLAIDGTSGNVGIGTTSPEGKIDVRGNYGRWRISGYGGMYFRNDSDTGYTRYIHPRSDGTLSFGRIADTGLSGTAPDKFAASSYDQFYLDSSGTAYFNGGINFAGVNGANFVVDTDGQRIVWEHQRNGTRKMTFYHEADADTFNFNFESGNKLQINGNRIVTVNELGTAAASAATDFVAVTGDEMTGKLTLNQNVTIGGTTPTNGNLVITDGTNTLGIDSNEIHSTSAMYIGTNSGDLILRPAGNVGIGTTNPQTELHVKGTNGWGEVRVEGQTFASGHGASLEFYSEGTALADIYASTDKHLYFRTNGGTERMRITSAGRVGIGTTNPAYHIHGLSAESGWGYSFQNATGDEDVNVYMSHGGGYGIAVDSTENASNKYLLKLSGGTGGGAGIGTATRMIVTAAGNVGIGTTSPAEKLHIGSGTVPAATLDGVLLTLGTSQYYQASDGTKNVFMGVDNSSYGIVGMLTDHDLGLRTNNIPRLYITNTGNVGIGTTNPVKKLDVRGGYFITSDGGTNEEAFVQGGNGYAYFGNYSAGKAAFGNSENWTTLVADGGNVGIGTTSPATKLEVNGDIGIGRVAGGYTFRETVGGGLRASMKSNASNELIFSYGADSEAMRINLAGNIGIGTNSPGNYYSNKLVVNAGSENGITIVGGTSDINYLMFADGTVGNARYRGMLWYQHSTDMMAFSTSGANRMFIDSVGNVGINTSSPAEKLDVIGNIRSYSAANNYGMITNGSFLAVGNHGGTLMLDLDNNGSADLVNIKKSGTSRFYITNGGNVGIGTTSPTAPLHVIGTVRMGNTSDGLTFTSGSGIGNIIGVDTGFAGYNAVAIKASANTGIYLDTADNVGIGTASPTRKLQVDAAAGYPLSLNSTQQYLMEFARGGVSEWWFAVNNGDFKFHRNGVGDKVIIKAGGNVGIGTTSPTAKLDVIGVGRILMPDDPTTGAITAKILSYSNAPYGMVFRSYSSGTSSIQVQRESSDSETFALSLQPNGGNVGIGTTSPEGKLDVVADDGSTTSAVKTLVLGGGTGTTGNGQYIQFRSSSNVTLGSQISGSRTGAGAASDLRFSTTGSDSVVRETMRITDSGNVGIGTTVPAAKLDVRATSGYAVMIANGDVNDGSNNKVQIRFGYDATSLYSHFITTRHNSASSAGNAIDFFTSDSTSGGIYPNNAIHGLTIEAGNVGIGTTSPSYKLDVNGNIRVGTGVDYNSKIVFTRNGGANVGAIGWHSDDAFYVAGHPSHGSTAGNIVRVYGFGSDVRLGDNSNGDVLTVNYSNGNVGIGTTSPSGKLEVNGDGTNTGGIALREGTNQVHYIYTDGPYQYNNIGSSSPNWRWGQQGADTKMALNNTGLGIGTNSPDSKLEVAGGTTGILLSNLGDSSAYDAIRMTYSGYNSGTPEFIFQPKTAPGSGTVNSYFRFQTKPNGGAAGTGNVANVTIDGNLGIGTTSPSAKLHVHHTSEEVLRIDSGTTGAIHFFENTTRRGILGYSNGTSIATDADAGDMVLRAESGSKLHLAIAGTSRLTVSGSNIGIGTTSPLYKLDVASGNSSSAFGLSLSGTARLKMYADGTYNYFAAQSGQSHRFTTTGGAEFLISNGGNVGIGTASPSEKLHVVGDTRIEGNLTVNGTYTQIDTDTNTTEQWNVTNDGTGPAVTINQTGAQDIMDVQDDGTSVFYIEDGGNVGIGTTDPTNNLEVSNSNSGGVGATLGIYNPGYNANSSSTINLGRTSDSNWEIKSESNADGGRDYDLIFSERDKDDTTHEEYLRLKSTGALKISSYGSNSFTGTAAYALAVDSSGNVIETAVQGSPTGGSGTAGKLTKWDTSSTLTDSVITESSGNIGIGTASPSHPLHVEGFIASNNSSNASGLLVRKSGSTIGFIGQSGGWVGDTTDDLTLSGETGKNIRFYTNGSITERMRITSGGNVGIGTTSPALGLHVANGLGALFGPSGSGASTYISADDENTINGGYGLDTDTADLWVNYRGYQNGTSRFRDFRVGNGKTGVIAFFDGSSGNVGIGTTSPVAKLDVNGATRIGGKTTYTKAYGSLNTTGNAVAGLGTSGNGASARLVFEIHGGAGEYQRVVYSCYNAGGNWYPTKVIDEGTNAFDVTDSGNGTTVTFTFKARTASQAYSPYVTIEHVGAAIDTSYL